MKLQTMFQKDINRDINGVVKVAQNDDNSLKQELSEYIITRELRRHFSTFFDNYSRAIDRPTDKISVIFGEDTEQARKVAVHKEWLSTIRHERPQTDYPFRVAVYIRFFNQTRYENYLEYHKKRFADTIALCPQWTLVDFYIDEGSTAPNMETAPAWSRLLDDCYDGKIDLIITQKISNVARRLYEVTLCARLLAAHEPPIGIYFISEDVYTLASYYLQDLRDPYFLPSPDWQILPDDDSNYLRYIND